MLACRACAHYASACISDQHVSFSSPLADTACVVRLPENEFNNARALSRDRFSVTPTAIYDELVRNAQKLQSLWNEDATRRQARMSSPLDEDEEVVQTQSSDEQVGVAENAAETVPRLSDEHLDIDSEFRSGKGKFKNWQDVEK